METVVPIVCLIAAMISFSNRSTGGFLFGVLSLVVGFISIFAYAQPLGGDLSNGLAIFAATSTVLAAITKVINLIL